MMKKVSPLFYTGLCLNVIGFALRIVFADMTHNWVSIPIFILGSALLIISRAKEKKE
ncbi:MAG: hypothetical protein LBV47_02685 [Bacteroidales bacterium]|jgi:hypothetical protein|nr:hypothetical protein [Bacteroidales bacterium]